MTKDKDILDIQAFFRDLSDTDSKDNVIPDKKKEEIVWHIAQPEQYKEKTK